MNNGIVASGYAPPQMPGGLLGSPAPLEMIDAYGYDADARRYIRAVEAADGQPLELAVRTAINEFVVGCKADGIWSAIKASCILMGARTLSGILTPLVGSAPTNTNFVSGDYARKTGLIGNGSTKFLNTNRANNADGQNDNHNSVYITAMNTAGVIGAYMAMGGSSSETFSAGANMLSRSTASPYNSFSRSRSTSATVVANTGTHTGLLGSSRSASGSYTHRAAGANTTVSVASDGVRTENLWCFRRSDNYYDAGRIAFYSIGSSLDLALLDTRVSNLYTQIGLALT